MKKTTFHIIAILLLSIAAGAQSTATLTGTLRDARTNLYLIDANVMIEEHDRATTTDSLGAFRFAHLPPGPCTLVVSYVGYRTRFIPITLNPGGENRLAVLLQPEPIQLHRVLVEADPAALSTTSSRPVRDFDLRVRPHYSATDLLRATPGLVAVGQGGGRAQQLFMRGFDSGFGADVAIAVDGMPVNLVSHGHGQGYADLNFLIPELVERMELFKGPYFARFGNLANAGQILLHTHDRLPQNSLRIATGPYATTRYTLLYQLPDTTESATGAYFAGDYYRTDGPFTSPQDLRRLTLFAKVRHRLSEEAVLTASAGGVSSIWDESGLIPVRAVEQERLDRWDTVDDSQGGTTSRRNLNIAYRQRDGRERDDLSVQLYLSDYDLTLFSDYTYFLQDPIFGDMVEQTDSRRIAGLDSRYTGRRSLGPLQTTASLGGGFRADDIELEMWQSVRRRRYWPLVDARVRERNYFLWGQEELLLGPAWRLILGLRGDQFTFQVEDQLEAGSQGVLPLSEWVKTVLWEKHTGARGKPLHVALIQPHASGVARKFLLSPKAGLVCSPATGVDLFANFGLGFHSNDARSVVIGQFVREQWQAMERRGAEEDVIVTVLDTLNFTPEQRHAPIVPRTVGAEVGFRLRLLTGGTSYAVASPERHFAPQGPGLGHYPGNTRLHAPVTGLGGRLNLGVSLWWIDVDEEFIYVADLGSQEERGRTRRRGVDLELRMQLLPYLWADLDANWARGRLRDAADGADAIPLAPRFTSQGGLTLRPGSRWEATLRYRHLDDRPAIPDGGLVAEGYTLFDLTAAFHAGPCRLDLSLENLFDTDWREAQFAYQSLLPWEGELSIRGPEPDPDIHFTPGNPRLLKLGLSYFF